MSVELRDDDHRRSDGSEVPGADRVVLILTDSAVAAELTELFVALDR